MMTSSSGSDTLSNLKKKWFSVFLQITKLCIKGFSLAGMSLELKNHITFNVIRGLFIKITFSDKYSFFTKNLYLKSGNTLFFKEDKWFIYFLINYLTRSSHVCDVYCSHVLCQARECTYTRNLIISFENKMSFWKFLFLLSLI